MSDIELTTAGKARALQAIEAVHQAYVAKDGLRAAREHYAKQHAGTCAHIYSLAKWACAHTETLPSAVVTFVALCAHAETEYKAKLGLTEDKFAKELAAWRVFKSQIKCSMQLGLSPAKHSTLHQLKQARDAKAARRKRALRPKTVHRMLAGSLHAEVAEPLEALILAAQNVPRTSRVASVVKRALREVTVMEKRAKSELRAA